MAETLKRSEVLRHRSDIDRVMAGRRIGGAALYLRFSPRPPDPPAPTTQSPTRRIAFLIPRGVRGAVRRNRLKRRLREIYRRNKDWFPPRCDCALQVSPQAARLSFDELLELVAQIGRKVRDGCPGT
jgi:ribonuclease P protein component